MFEATLVQIASSQKQGETPATALQIIVWVPFCSRNRPQIASEALWGTLGALGRILERSQDGLGMFPGRSWDIPGTLWDAWGRSQDALGRLRGALWTSQGLLGGTFGQNLFADLWPCGFGLDLASIAYDLFDRCAHRFYIPFGSFLLILTSIF